MHTKAEYSHLQKTETEATRYEQKSRKNSRFEKHFFMLEVKNRVTKINNAMGKLKSWLEGAGEKLSELEWI